MNAKRKLARIADAMAESNDAQVVAFGMELRAALEDTMAAGFNRPVTISRAALVSTLRDMADAVEQNDSAGGFVEYEWSDEPDRMDVRAHYRIGNAEGGQGGMRIVHEPPSA